jgi:hypothetical protein
MTGDIEVDLETATVRLHIRDKSGSAVAPAEIEINEWDSVL